jgi:calcineurin-like phosphoesterase family protein
MTLFFESDFHFNHRLMLQTRPQFHSLDEMNDTFIENHNKVVTEHDTVYYGGDFSWSDPEPFLNRLNGHFVFIRGNHDKRIPRHKKIIHSVDGYYDTKFNEQKFTVCHYPMHSWNCSHWGSWLMYGHHHRPTDFGGKTINCSMDARDFKPISWDEIVEYMKNRPDNWDLIKEKT